MAQTNMLDAVEKYMQEILPIALQRRLAVQQEMRDIDTLTQRTRISRRVKYAGASDINVPLIRAQRKAARTRLFQVLFGQSPACRMRPVKGRDSTSEIDHTRAAQAAQYLFEFAHKRADHLDAREAVRKVIMQFVDYGLGGFKVVPVRTPLYTGPRWYFVSIGDLLYPEGLGTDLNAFPYFGQVYSLTHVQARARKDFDAKRIAEITTMSDEDIAAEMQRVMEQFTDVPLAESVERVRNLYAEVWYTWEDGREYVCDVHVPTLRLVGPPRPNQWPRRPYFYARLDDRTPLSFGGIGLPRDLESVQEIINALLNGAVDSVSVALGQVKLVRHGSMLAEIVGEGNDALDIGPNAQLPTENPEADLVVKPLGDPRGAATSLQMIESIRQLAFELTGLGRGQMGDISMTKRASATGVSAVLAEGSFPIRDASQRLAEAFQDAILMTFDQYAMTAPQGFATGVLGDNGEVLDTVFAMNKKASDVFTVEVDVADPSKDNDSAQQRAIIRAQFVLTWYEKLAQVLPMVSNPMAPPAMRDAFVEITRKSEELIRRVLEAADEVKDPEALLIDVEALFGAVSAAMPAQPQQPMMPGGEMPMPMAPAQPAAPGMPGEGAPA